jgi:peptide/nickel transport system substrate-binding protein
LTPGAGPSYGARMVPYLRRLTAVLLIVGLAALAGCSASEEEGPPRGGTLRLSLSEVPDLNPWTSIDPLSTPYLVLLFDGLVRLDSAGTVRPAQAATWAVSDDGLSYTFELRPGLEFEDGTPVSAHDYVRAFERTFTRDAAGHGRPRFWSIDGAVSTKWRKSISPAIEAADSLTLSIRLWSRDRDFLKKLALPRFAVPLAAGQDPQTARPLGSGAYRRVPGSSTEIVLARNPHYTGESAGYVDTIRVRVGVNARRAVQGVSSGRIDVLWPVSLSSRARLMREPGVSHLAGDSASGPIWLLVFNSAVLPTARKPARQAIAFGINRMSLVDEFGEAIEPWNTFGDDPEGDPALAAPGFDPERSREALSRALHPLGMRVAITVPRESQEAEIAAALLGDLGLSGIHGEIRDLSRARYWEALTANRGTVASILAWQPYATDPLAALSEAFLNSSLDPRWWGNLGYYRTDGAALDTLLLRGLRADSAEEREASVRKTRERLAADIPVIPLGRGRQELFYTPRVRGLEFHPWYGPDWAGVWLEAPS